MPRYFLPGVELRGNTWYPTGGVAADYGLSLVIEYYIPPPALVNKLAVHVSRNGEFYLTERYGPPGENWITGTSAWDWPAERIATWMFDEAVDRIERGWNPTPAVPPEQPKRRWWMR